MKGRLSSLALAAFIATQALAGPKDEAFAVIARFKAAYDASDPVAVAATFAPDALFLGTGMPKPTRDPAEVLKYFQGQAAANLPKRVEIDSYDAIEASDSVVLFAGQNTFFQTNNGTPGNLPARFTFLIVKRPEGWRISHFHSSRRP